MNLYSIFLIALSLAMDAFAVSLTIGLKFKKPKLSSALYVGLMFGFFQFLMPIIGFFAAYLFIDYIQAFSSIIAFVLLVFIGGHMLKEAFSKDDDEEEKEFALTFKYLLPLAIATSIDAMSVGITFALLDVAVFSSSTIIGVTAFIISAIGVYLGNLLGTKLQSKAEIFGGCVLILMGFKILLG